MKKILIISYNFAPRQSVGSIRPTKLAQYLAAAGHEVDVVTAKPYGDLDHSMDNALELVHRMDCIDFRIVEEKPAAKNQTVSEPQKNAAAKKTGALRKLKKELYECKKIKRSTDFAREFVKLVKSDLERFRSYDAVISSYGPVASHLCGLEFKKLCPGVMWIADFRDPMVLNISTRISGIYRRRIQKKVCKKADRLVAVSHGYYERIFDEEDKKKASVVYNGFDRADIDTSAVEPDGEFSFTYVGIMYDGKRDFSPLLRLLTELIDEGEVSAADVKIKYAGTTFGVLKAQAERTGFKGQLVDLGKLPRTDCLKLQASSRHLLLSTWNEKGEYGVFPGKFLEYIMIGRPIVSFVSGDEPGSEVTAVMKRARLGVTYENATAEEDIPALREYLIRDYKAFKEGRDAEFSPDAAEVARFDFANTAKSFEEIIDVK
ncbi:MAG: glycosyltransferase [Clostridia bacterium]|nr:glycosyltransferase [Clostridia bacterium]